MDIKEICRTKYPIMLIHGIGHTDTESPDYWMRIPDALRLRGARVFFGGQDSFGSIKENGIQIAEKIIELTENGSADKLNLIAHSKGGLDARYAVSMCGISAKTVTLTTIATPHRGIRSIDIMKRKRKISIKGLLWIFNTMIRAGGGHRPESNDEYEKLSCDYMDVFNQYVKNASGVYYQSYAFDMKNMRTDIAFALFYGIVKMHSGRNDGIVDVESAKWGDFKGIITGPGKKGISHSMAVDRRGKSIAFADIDPISYETPDGRVIEYTDIVDLYVNIVSELKEKGY